MTTNHIDRLDPALLRPGRIDVKALIDNASAYQIKKMFIRFYGDEKMAEEFTQKLQGSSVSTAQLQGHFVFFKMNPRGALDNTDWLIKPETGIIKSESK